MTIIEILNYSKKVLENVTLGAVNKITKNKYDINNFPDNQKVSGKVEVSNLPKEQKVLLDFPDVQKVEGKVKTDTKPFFKSIFNKLHEVVLALGKVLSVKVTNFPEPKDFPKSVKISNLPKEKEVDFSNVEKKLSDVEKAIGKLPKSYPKAKEIVFPKQKDIVVPDEVIIKNLEFLKSKKAGEYVPVRLTDGDEFYEAFSSIVSRVKSFFSDSNGKKKDALVDADRHLQVDVLTSPEVTVDTSELATSDNQTNGTQQSKLKEVSPIDATQNNPSYALTYTSDELTGIAMTISGTTYNRTLTWTSNSVTAISVWTEA